MALRVGSVLAGRYEITAPIAAGGMGEVWLATDRVLMRTVAAKVLKSEFTGDPSFLSRFRNEARHTAALTHQNIASVYDYGETEADGQSLAYLVMEYVEGDPLVTVLAQRGRLSPAETLDVVGQAAAGLSAAHRAGVVHRDIKPGNLIVRPDGVVKLTDFGIARARDATPLTRTGMVVGTAQYLSPEQAQGYDVTPASDVYSLGVLAYECLVGRRPFDGDSQVAIALAQVNRPPPPLPADVPPSVQALVERALAKDPAARWPDGAAFAAAVRHVAAGGGLAAPATGTQVLGADSGQGSDDRTRVFPASPGPRTGPSTGPSTGQGGRQMPPLHGPPVNDPTTTFPRGAALGGAAGAGALAGGAAGGRGAAAASPDAPPSRRRRLLLIGAAALVLVLGGGVAAAQLFDTDERGGGVAPSTSVSTSTAPATTSQSAPTTTDRDDEEDEPTTEPEATTTEPTAPTTTAVPTTTAAPTTTSTPAPTTTAAPTTTPSASTQTTTTAPGSGNSGGNGGGTGSPTPPTPTTDGVGGGDGDGGDDEGGATAGRDR